jgi:GntR family transcriptional regulator/MocR family aminotransferase
VTDWSGDVVTQGALAAFLADGHLATHVRRATRVYGERRRLLLDALDRRLADILAVQPSVAGLHVAATFLDGEVDDAGAVARAREAGVALDPLSPRYRGPVSRSGLVLGFGGVAAADIPSAVGTLARVLRP